MFTFFRAIVLSLGIITLLSGGVRASSCIAFKDYAYGDNPSKNGYAIAWTGYDSKGDLTIIWEHKVNHRWILMNFVNQIGQVCQIMVGTTSRTRILGLDI